MGKQPVAGIVGAVKSAKEAVGKAVERVVEKIQKPRGDPWHRDTRRDKPGRLRPDWLRSNRERSDADRWRDLSEGHGWRWWDGE